MQRQLAGGMINVALPEGIHTIFIMSNKPIGFKPVILSLIVACVTERLQAQATTSAVGLTFLGFLFMGLDKAYSRLQCRFEVWNAVGGTYASPFKELWL